MSGLMTGCVFSSGVISGKAFSIFHPGVFAPMRFPLYQLKCAYNSLLALLQAETPS